VDTDAIAAEVVKLEELIESMDDDLRHA
jgi:hypothetical protein